MGQQKKVEILLKLVKENPELRIVPMVRSEGFGDDYSYYVGSWGEAFIEEIYVEDERIFIKSIDEDEMIEIFVDRLYDEYDLWDKSLSSDLIEEIGHSAEEKVRLLPWEKVILVHIDSM